MVIKFILVKIARISKRFDSYQTKVHPYQDVGGKMRETGTFRETGEPGFASQEHLSTVQP